MRAVIGRPSSHLPPHLDHVERVTDDDANNAAKVASPEFGCHVPGFGDRPSALGWDRKQTPMVADQKWPNELGRPAYDWAFVGFRRRARRTEQGDGKFEMAIRIPRKQLRHARRDDWLDSSRAPPPSGTGTPAEEAGQSATWMLLANTSLNGPARSCRRSIT